MSLIHLTENKRTLFWLLQLWGWSAWVVTYYLGVAFWGKTPSNYFTYLSGIAVVGMLLTLVLRQLYHFTWDLRPVMRALTVLTACYAAGFLWITTRSVVFYRFYPEETASMAEKGGLQLAALFENSLSASSVMLLWSAVYFGIKYYLLTQEEKQRYLKALSQAHEAQLKMLRYQLNPHFLFNTLNAISTLILDQDSTTANGMVTKLSRFLRYSLDNDPMQEVTVAEEIESLRLYLDIEKVRFGDRLNLQFDVEPVAANALMPSLLLQPLVENSIKYAISRAIDGGSISVSARVSDDALCLTVADDGPGLELSPKKSREGGGVGLANTKDRLLELYGGNQSFSVSNTEPHGLTINICMPYRTKA